MAAPSLRIPVSADITQFQRQMEKTSDIARSATIAVAKQGLQMSASWLASQGAAGGAALAFGRVLGVLGPIALGITAVRDAFRLMAYATDLAKVRIAEFNKVADEANASGFSTEFFQRATKGAATTTVKIDDLTESLKRFNAESTPKLGGSNLQQRIDQLSKAGNFQGNTGIAELAGSNDSEGRLRATVSLINQAMQSGERLAAIDLASVFGSKVQDALRTDSGYLDQMLKRADAMKQTQIISDADLGRAIELKQRMEAAQKVLAEKWRPIQDDLAIAGTNYHESWVGITERLAQAVGLATSLYSALKEAPDWLAAGGNASIWKKLSDLTESLGLNSRPDDLITDKGELAAAARFDKLRVAMQNYQNVVRSMKETTEIVEAVRGDKSRVPGGKSTPAPANAFDTAADALARHTARTEADTKAVGLGANALAEFRAQATLMVAAQQAGIPVTEALRTRINGLAKEAGAAAEGLARAKVASEISFGKQTAFLTPEDTQIARQLASIYGNNVPAALASSEAAALRMNNALTDISRTLQDTNRGAFQDFAQQIRNGATAMDALRTAGVNALGKIADKLMQMAADNLWSAAFGGSGGLGGALANLFKGGSAPGSFMVGAQSFPMFASGTNSAPGGLSIVGEKGPELLNIPRGAQVIPNDVLRRMTSLPDVSTQAASTQSSVSVSMPISIDARGADREGLARVEGQLAALKADLPARVVSAVQDAKRRRVMG
ncbi:conserved hypothetical protein [Afipia carboxidovorans OM5]|uniref:Bacteriophage tail tape measure N-terminal domain-containing protein n=1 Tax=Afipia carboxidovorans (strain ATCC 49405 / DSM 1227 / KCTC 32145 / OM5) TaxID=504832 RepID=B6JED4_AFIC5|nr:hypothetical protein [Afipia carboxidovorans]ACI93250.1 conserved hypothetical protein [Afipia carboxidovorans OM5]AEI03028.1 hypothetical protein OCA4_c18910 [Afipia carboxidovorans OM4]AEI06605.1 hypothetical protein OCA5_c18920 [Afipia carboxidovorans OM5]